MVKTNVIILILVVFACCHTVAQAGYNDKLLDSISNYINELEIQHHEIVLRQVILETGWLRSPFLMKKNNLFGFKSRHLYRTFEHWKSSIEYYKKWQDKYYSDPEEDYYIFLNRMKYASRHYVKFLKSIKVPEVLIGKSDK